MLNEISQVDHIQPLFMGGSNHIENLQYLCPNCHAWKTLKERRRYNARKQKNEVRCLMCGDVHSRWFDHRCKPLDGPLAKYQFRKDCP